MFEIDYQLSTDQLRQKKYDRDEYRKLQRNPISILLDTINGGHNLGSIIRIAEALMVERLHIPANGPSPEGKRARKMARGAQNWVPITPFSSTCEQLDTCRKQGYQIVAVELTKKSQLYTETTYAYPTLFVLGNETLGVSSEALDMVDFSVHLPIYGMVNSLNVATAASVILYDAAQKYMTSLNT
ncbi:TrmH family RNA methyltransferase [Desulfogranum japonicum]|uniref:TrmH family RNA methyltransferase n=1 Tax=Desulfogranum japonicum TaxID=231447 RepID=UPI00041725A7|nr:TrmH family RNA methyltransferase [Desulfogranum japonicum]